MGLVSSMTGYGRAEARGARVVVAVEVRSLNHRFLEVTVKVPRGFTSEEPDLRRLVQARAARGRVDLTVSVERVGGSVSSVRTDPALAAEYLRGARSLAESVGVAGDMSLTELLRLPGVLTVTECELDQGETPPLMRAAAADALGSLARMRETEGAALARELGTLTDQLLDWVGDLEARLPEAVARIQARLRERIRTLLGEAPADPARLAQEVATLAARSDVAEEVSRLRSHVAQFQAILAEGGAIGRRLDFLAQELHREVNTIASKADDGQVIDRILTGRTLVERVREQVQNVE